MRDIIKGLTIVLMAIIFFICLAPFICLFAIVLIIIMFVSFIITFVFVGCKRFMRGLFNDVKELFTRG